MTKAVPDDEDVVREAHALARESRLDECASILRLALARLEAADVDDHRVARLADELAVVLTQIGEVSEAEAFYARALAAKRRHGSPSSLEIAATLHNWALLCEMTGRTERAALLWAEADAALGKAHGLEGPAGNPP